MTAQDQQNLLHFVQRPKMFVLVWDRANIASYLHGYEEGSMGRCTFLKQLSERISKQYRVKHQSNGWPGQLDTLAKKLGKAWEETFQLVALEILEPTVTASKP